MHPSKLEPTLDRLVTALCLDYSRRQKIIEERSASKRTDTELRYYNFLIYDAAAEVVGERDAEIYINEIGRNIGYAKSTASYTAESVYKGYKQYVKENIAKKLHLI